mgnify:CR=1 FL=1
MESQNVFNDGKFVIYEDVNIAQRDGELVLRKEQDEAISKAKGRFMKNQRNCIMEPGQRKFLWNAKMRFGKTLCALQLAKDMKVNSTLIVTHRPVVDDSWHEEFEFIMVKNCKSEEGQYRYGSKSDDNDKYTLEKFNDLVEYASDPNDNRRMIFFVSMQYLRRHKMFSVKGDEAPLKTAILNHKWDFIVVDEAHEGTRTSLGQHVIDYLYKDTTKMLHLSGTPFNLYNDFEENEIYTWDYTSEQRAKAEWIEANNKKKNPEPPENNPYYDLPEMTIFTYNLGKLRECEGLLKEDSTFQFKEFFRTFTGNEKIDGTKGEKGKFVHEDAVIAFLNQMCEDSETSNYPFSTDEYRDMFAHTLWVVPGVKEAKALTELLHDHEVFGECFDIVNVAGEKEDDEEDDNALQRVKDAIGEDPTQTRTITISCGRLTTGVTVKPWTAVFYMKGSDNTSAATYMQTIFRVQSPYTPVVDGVQQMKTHCYVFDFAPDRSLKMIAETANFSSLVGKKRKNADTVTQESEEEEREKLEEFLKFCPVVSLDGGVMRRLDTKQLIHDLVKSLARVKIERIAQNGMDDDNIFDLNELMKMDVKVLADIGERGGSEDSKKSKREKQSGNLEVTKSGLTSSEKNDITSRTKKKLTKELGREPSQEELDEAVAKAQEDAQKKKDLKANQKARMREIRGILIRIPLLIFGAELADDSVTITRDNFTRLFRVRNEEGQMVDSDDWKEFMPKGITTEDFKTIRKCIKEVEFEEVGKLYRHWAKEADKMPVNERIQGIRKIFDCFQNPDKETVLTPWDVVNRHMSDCLGGYCFYNEQFDGPNMVEITLPDGKMELQETVEPRFVNQGNVTNQVFNSEAKILEINSKSGLYPLYVTYSLFRRRMVDYIRENLIDNVRDYPNEKIEQELATILNENVPLKDQYVVWDDILRNNIYVICNTEMAVKITRRTLRGYRDIEYDKYLHIKSSKLIDRVNNDKEKLIKDLKSPLFWGENTNKEEMKFTAIVGNPPYQENLEDGRSLAKQLFPKFIELGVGLKPSHLCLITPSRWFTADAQDNSFPKLREFAKNNNHFVTIISNDGKKLFPNTDLSMVNYFLWTADYVGDVTFVENYPTYRDVMSRPLFEDGMDIILPQNKLIPIIKKVLNIDANESTDVVQNDEKKFVSLMSITTGRDAFGIVGKNIESRTKTNPFTNSVKVQCAYEEIRYMEKSLVTRGQDILNSYKVFTSKGNGGAGLLTDNKPVAIIGKAFVAEPNMACTDSMIPFGKFNNLTEAVNLQKYMSTKFLRFMVGILKVSQNLYQNVYQFVPLQDFTGNSNIDWSKSIEEIDMQLYAIYNFDPAEIKYIESMIKPL